MEAQPEPSSTAFVFRGCHRRGGVERSIWELSRHLQASRQLTFVGTDFDASELPRVSHVPVASTRGPVAPLSWRRNAEKVLAGIAVRTVVSFGATSPPGDVLYVNSVHREWLDRGRGVRRGGIPVPRWVRRVLPRHQMLLALERSYFKKSRGRRVIAVSEAVRADLERIYDVDPSTVTVIPNGYSPDECSLERRLELREPERERHGYGPDDVLLLMVANELHRKGLAVLIEAVERCGDERVHIAIAGRTRPTQFEAEIARLGLTARIRWLGPVADIGRAHALADWFVLPTQYEAFSLAVVEALASGLPVITTAVPGAGDLVTDGVNGFLQHDPLDAEELTALLARALSGGSVALQDAAAASVNGLAWSEISQAVATVLDG